MLAEEFAPYVSAATAVVDTYTADTLAIFCEQKSKPSKSAKSGKEHPHEPAADGEEE